MEAEDIEIIEQLIKFCPICGHASKKEFDIVSVYGGSFVCEACEEGIEVNFVEFEEVEEPNDEETDHKVVIMIAIIVILCLIFIFS